MNEIIFWYLFNISHFSSTACTAAMAKRAQQGSGEERVTVRTWKSGLYCYGYTVAKTRRIGRSALRVTGITDYVFCGPVLSAPDCHGDNFEKNASEFSASRAANDWVGEGLCWWVALRVCNHWFSGRVIKSYVYDLPFVTTIEVLVAVWLRSPAFGQALTRAFCAMRIRSPVSDRHWLAPLASCATSSQSSDSLLCHQGNRSTPSFVLFTDTEYLIGDALRHPGNTAFDAIGKFSGRKMEFSHDAKFCRLYGQRTSDWRRTANPENTVLTPASGLDLTVDWSDYDIDVSGLSRRWLQE